MLQLHFSSVSSQVFLFNYCMLLKRHKIFFFKKENFKNSSHLFIHRRYKRVATIQQRSFCLNTKIATLDDRSNLFSLHVLSGLLTALFNSSLDLEALEDCFLAAQCNRYYHFPQYTRP